MKIFRKLYYKFVTLFCLVATFVFLFNIERVGIGYACFYIFVGLLSFGSLSIGKEEFDTEKPIRNILLLLGWSFLGFGIMSMGISTLLDSVKDSGLMTALIILTGLGLVIVYIISVIVNKEIYAIISIALVVIGFILGANSSGTVVLAILTILSFIASIVFFVLSIIKMITSD